LDLNNEYISNYSFLKYAMSILNTKLLKGQEMKVGLIATKKISKDYAKWLLVAIVTFQHAPKFHINKVVVVQGKNKSGSRSLLLRFWN
jgi:hypothetical protein